MNSLSQELSFEITAWLEKSSHRSLSMLARLSSVPYPTLRRIAQTEVDLPSPEVCLSICDVVCTREKTRELIARYYPAIGRLLTDIKLLYPPPSTDSLREYLYSPKHLPIILLASTKAGIELDDLIELFGGKAREYTQELLDVGVLVRNGPCYVLSEKVGIGNLEWARQATCALIKMCRKKTDATVEASQAYVTIEGLSPDAVKQLGSITESYRKELFSVISSPENQGDVIWFGSVVTNVLKHEELL